MSVNGEDEEGVGGGYPANNLNVNGFSFQDNEKQSIKYIGTYSAVPASWLDYSQEPTLFVETDLKKEISYFLRQSGDHEKHVFELCESGYAETFVFEKYFDKSWVRWHLHPIDQLSPSLQPNSRISQSRRPSSKSRIVSTKKWAETDLTNLLDLWKEERILIPGSDEKKTTMSLEMKPPLPHSSEGTLTGSLQQIHPTIDPGTYLRRKYYEALFTFKIPLAYFAKSNLARARNMSGNANANNNVTYQMHIADLLLEIHDFDQRHDGNGSGILNHDLNPGDVSDIRDSCLGHFDDLKRRYSAQCLGDLRLLIKIREIKLQMMLLLELIAINQMDIKLKNFEEKYKAKLKKRAKRVARKNMFSRSAPKRPKIEPVYSSLDFCEKLDIYADKLCIIDTMLLSNVSPQKNPEVENASCTPSMARLSEYKKNLTNSGKESSTIGFMTYVLIPYFTRKTPHAVRFISRKFKGLRLNNSIRPDKLSTSAHLTHSVEAANERVNAEVPSSPPSEDSSKTSSVCTNITSPPMQQPPKVFKRVSFPNKLLPSNVRSKSQLSEFLELESGLSKKLTSATRANSDLLLDKLQKRQMPATEFSVQNTTSLTRESSFMQKQMHSTRTSSSIMFQRVGKRLKEQKRASLETANFLNVQVEATPHGKKSDSAALPGFDSTIIESPLAATEQPSHPGGVPLKAAASIRTPSRQFGSPTGDVQVPASNAKELANTTDVIASPQIVKTRRVRRRLFAPD
ncbi:LAQU0S02e10462g1_1 [Lachancea quebecensis]|uniref:LAQU0S02e10462g1_1 n=1 Tax=Lachancea quebecensis TaxID=1654605 RepID=A0A0P1KP73_9SACH|nr:LAQU0S02e10462g1_1 [Lachancea quebecensis]